MEYVGPHVQAEVDPKQEFDLKTIHLWYENTANFRVIRIVVVSIIEEFGSEQNGSDDNTVYIKLGQKKIISLDEPVNVDESKDEALSWARSVLVDPVSVFERKRGGKG